MSLLLSVENISVSYGKEHILDKVTFALTEGQIMTILGPNGVGKSTLLRCIVGLQNYMGGPIILGEKCLEELSMIERSRFVAYVPQSIELPYMYSIEDFVIMGRAPYISSLSVPSKKDRDLVHDMLNRLGLYSLRERSIMDVSGGERQKAMIAKALVQEPKIIILDEPTSALDVGNQMKVLSLVETLADKGYGIILTTHNPDHAIILDDVTGIVQKRGPFTFGPTAQVLTSQVLSEVFQTPLQLEYNKLLGRNICLTER